MITHESLDSYRALNAEKRFTVDYLLLETFL